MQVSKCTDDLYSPPAKKRRIDGAYSDSAKPRRKKQPVSSLLVILPETLVAYILQYFPQKDFFGFAQVSFQSREITRNPAYKRMMNCHAFLDRFHDHTLSNKDSCELMPYYVTLRFFNHEQPETTTTREDSVDMLTPVALRTPMKRHSVFDQQLPPSTPINKQLVFNTNSPPRQSIDVETTATTDTVIAHENSDGDDDALMREAEEEQKVSKPRKSRRRIERPFRHLRHLIQSFEFEFSDVFWKDTNLSSNNNFLALFCNAERLVIYDSERGRRLDASAFDWPKCKAKEIAADIAVLHTYALHRRDLFPRRVSCDTWGDLALQADLIWHWHQQSRSLGYETSFEVDVELPRIMSEGYIQNVSRLFGAPDFPFLDRFSTNFCNNINSTWDGVLVLPPTSELVFRYEHTIETQNWDRTLDFHQCAFHAVSVEWDITWCKKATNARFMVKFFESIADVLWGTAPTVLINVNEGNDKKVRAFLMALISDLSYMKSGASRALRNITFILGLKLKRANSYHHEHLLERISELCNRVRQFGVDFQLTG